MLVRYRGINDKGVLERPWTKWVVLRAISTTLKCQFTGKCRKVDFLTSYTTKSVEKLHVGPYDRYTRFFSKLRKILRNRIFPYGAQTCLGILVLWFLSWFLCFFNMLLRFLSWFLKCCNWRWFLCFWWWWLFMVVVGGGLLDLHVALREQARDDVLVLWCWRRRFFRLHHGERSVSVFSTAAVAKCLCKCK